MTDFNDNGTDRTIGNRMPSFSTGVGGPGGGGQCPPNYLVQSILVTLLCCLPLGIMAILSSNKVNTKFQAGDIAGANEASANAKKFITWGVIGGVIVIALNVAIQLMK